MQRSELDAACRRSGAIAGRRSPREGGAELRKISRGGAPERNAGLGPLDKGVLLGRREAVANGAFQKVGGNLWESEPLERITAFGWNRRARCPLELEPRD